MKLQFVVILSLLPLAAAAQATAEPRVATPLALPLSEALRLGLQNSLDVQVSRAEVEIRAAQTGAGFAGGLPSVGFTAANTELVTNLQQELANGTSTNRMGVTGNQTAASLTGSFTLFNGGRVTATRQRLDELQAQGELQLNAAIQQVLADVLLRYYAVVRQQRYVQTLEASVAVSRQKLALVLTRQSVGLANNADRFQAELDLQSQLQTQRDQRLGVRQATAELLRALNQDVTGTTTVEDTIPLDRSLQWPEIQAALVRNPGLLAAERQQRIAELTERETRALRAPALTLNGGANFNRNQSTAGFTLLNQTYGPFVGVGLSVPIYNGGTTRRLERVARLGTQNAQAQYQGVQRDNELAAYSAWLAYEQNLQQVDSAEVAFGTARQLLQLTQLRLEAGLTTLVDVRIAQQTFEAAGYALVNYRYAAKAAEINLRQVAALLQP
ncbi:MAG: TolC family protein [Hymenobacteraceae bacterium]|nr:TolC family protein [Hymenobacteraceae bacterium]